VRNPLQFVTNPLIRTLILYSLIILIGYSIVILFMDITGSSYMKEGVKALQLGIVCRCGARNPDEECCDHCCFMSEEPGAYWDEDGGWMFKTPSRLDPLDY
jgi:hypothetical protein